ncbi:hypothetical protein DSOL_0974 [Desulfosporosinus metallidurans]|uniref:Uncharacterized protein n=1 Tax=Desulfosporosinus metallidurans TaxID=1888891 RepID=A0A1Q8R0X0_9FIRM|nr:hypothetical protein DSOL_0974 [Desulfosporosinus metallidurans]
MNNIAEMFKIVTSPKNRIKKSSNNVPVVTAFFHIFAVH